MRTWNSGRDLDVLAFELATARVRLHRPPRAHVVGEELEGAFGTASDANRLADRLDVPLLESPITHVFGLHLALTAAGASMPLQPGSYKSRASEPAARLARARTHRSISSELSAGLVTNEAVFPEDGRKPGQEVDKLLRR
jgi:hypothetical protein